MRVQKFDFLTDLNQVLLWVYDKATNLKSLIRDKNDWYFIYFTSFWNNWYSNVFNLVSANPFGLSVWSHILNVPYYVNDYVTPDYKKIWGFNAVTGSTVENDNKNFDNGNFARTTFTLTVEEQRFLLRLRYFQICTRGDVTSVNSFLNYLITTSNINYSGTVYMLDNLDMSVTYVFTAPDFPRELLKVIQQLDVLPRCSCVSIIYDY